ncbi:hypothetical protein F4604DRAFT_171882 [Suillus subluteus]|nr:hypothetical protein F4604DRAFT_171882 [Suillus subluteus]
MQHILCSGSAQASFVITSRIPSFTILILVLTAWPMYHHVLNCPSDHTCASTQPTPPMRSSSLTRQYQYSTYISAPANTNLYTIAMHSTDSYYRCKTAPRRCSSFRRYSYPGRKTTLNSQSLIPAAFHLSPQTWRYSSGGRLQQHRMWSRRCLFLEGVVTFNSPDHWGAGADVQRPGDNALSWRMRYPRAAEVGILLDHNKGMVTESSPLVVISAQLKYCG